MLARKNGNGKERVFYFIRKTLVDYETRYVSIEKLCYAIIFAPYKLRHYLLGSTIHFVTNANPLNYLLIFHVMMLLLLMNNFKMNVLLQKKEKP